MRDRTAWCTAVALAASLPPLPQSPPRVVLAPANATLQDDFIALTSLRELSDGRVLLTDGRSQQIFVADFAAGSATPVARNGKGPLEYSFIGTLYATTGDSTIMLDVGNQRWLLFAGARVVGTVPPDHPAVKLASPLLGSDRLGRVVTTRRDDFISGVREYTRKDSQAVVLVSRQAGKADTVARVREQPRQATMTRDAAGTVTSSSTIPTETGARGEDVFLFDDGTLAILRLEPLRVDWRSPTGVWTRGAPLPLVGAAVTAADRAAAARQRENMEKAWKEAGIPFPAARPMPPTMPALDAARPLPIPDGRLALRRRSPASATDVRYVIVNRKGTIDGEITLAKGEALLGFGMRSVYISFKDADDVQRLRRHPWP